MKIIFGRNGGFTEALIRAVTWSRWHHVAIVDGEQVIESVTKEGVRRIALSNFKERYAEWEMAELPDVDLESALAFAESQIGKKYDWGAALSLFFRRESWGKPDKWFCSELVAAASGKFRNKRVGRVTPEHLWMISK